MGRAHWAGAAATMLVGLAACQAADPGDDPLALEHENVLIDLWADGTTAFGIFVALPAVWMFNYFTTKVDELGLDLNTASAELVDYFIKDSASRS